VRNPLKSTAWPVVYQGEDLSLLFEVWVATEMGRAALAGSK
jgi:hypothetical protein